MKVLIDTCVVIDFFEDAVMTETAIRSKMDCIITRNKKIIQKQEFPYMIP